MPNIITKPFNLEIIMFLYLIIGDVNLYYLKTYRGMGYPIPLYVLTIPYF